MCLVKAKPPKPFPKPLPKALPKQRPRKTVDPGIRKTLPKRKEKQQQKQQQPQHNQKSEQKQHDVPVFLPTVYYEMNAMWLQDPLNLPTGWDELYARVAVGNVSSLRLHL